MSAIRSSWPCRLLWLPLVAAAGCALAAAEGDGDGAAVPEDVRFDLFKADGEVYRFDRKTGEILKIVKTKEGFVAVAQHVQIVSRTPAKTREAPPVPRVGPNTTEGEMAQLDETHRKPAKASGATIPLYDEQGNDITYQLTDTEREAAQPAILGYQSSLSLLHTLDIGERITGNILVRNLGDRKLKVLELTLMIPVVGREKAEEQRFLYTDRPGQAGPPQPAGAAKEGNLVLQKVDLPCPAGGVKGSPVLKVSYLKFAE